MAWHDRPVERLLWVILGMAFVLRVLYLDRQSIWYDEGLSIYYARGTLIELLQGVSQSDHPPLHPLLLHLWIRLCGDSEFSVRMLSAWWGVLAVAMVYRLGRRLFGRPVGALAAFLLAVSPFAIWFAQETRGYALALALTLGAIDVGLDLSPQAFGVLRPSARPRWLPYLLYVFLATASLYTHFYSGFALLSLNLAFLAWWLAPVGPWQKRRLAGWLGAQVAVLALFALWLPFVVAQFDANATYWHGAVYWKEIVGQALAAFSVGTTLSGPWAQGATWMLALLALVGTLSLCWHRRDRLILVLLWLWALVPTLVLVVLTFNRPKFAPRYLLNVLPAFLLLVAVGLRWLFRLAHRHEGAVGGWTAWTALVVAVAIVSGATFRSLAHHYLDETLYRPDMRAMVRYIQAEATDRDLIVLLGGYIYPAFVYYYDGPLPVLPMPDKLLPTTQEPIEPDMLKALNEATVGRKHLWLVQWQPYISDPTGLVTDALEQTYHRLGVGRTFHDMALMCFDVSPGPLLTGTPRTPQIAEFAGQIRLLGYDLPVRQVRPGETVYLYLYWEALVKMKNDYKVFVQILDEGADIVAQQDVIAGAAEYPTSHWRPGAVIRNRFLLTTDLKAKPGRCRLITGFYNPGRELPRLPASGEGASENYVTLAEVEIQ